MELNEILKKGITLETSGTTGTPSKHFQSPEKLEAGNKAAIDAQELTADSRVYTVSKMSHAGGLLAQTLPAFSIGANITIENFNAFRFVRKIESYTHTHLAPGHALAVMATKGFKNLDLSGVWVTCGSDPVDWSIVESFLAQGATFMVNWGMTEIGPVAINSTFRSLEDLYRAQEYSTKGYLLGGNSYCDYKIVNDELYVRGDICVFDDWYATGDLVTINSRSEIYFKGRKHGPK